MVYHTEYDGYYRMKWHDNEENALKRWFENFKVEKYASFANEYECLIVKEVNATAKRISKRQVCVIEDEGRGTSREVLMDHSAPPAPMLTFAAKHRWTPPPPKTPEELRKDAEWERMYRKGYAPRIRRIPIMRIPYPSAEPDSSMATMKYREEIEWVPRRRDFDRAAEFLQMSQFTKPATPPAPKHRRNV